jgi:hypothetical protein
MAPGDGRSNMVNYSLSLAHDGSNGVHEMAERNEDRHHALDTGRREIPYEESDDHDNAAAIGRG